MVHKAHIIIAAVVLLTLFAMSAAAQPTTAAATAQSPAAPSFDINAAVDRYLAKMPPAQRARSNAYFEGGYWLLLWDFLCTIIVMWLLLRFRWSARMRNPGRARQSLPPYPHRALLDSIHTCRVRAHLPAHRLRRLRSRAQVRFSQPVFRSLDARPGGDARRRCGARRDTPGAAIRRRPATGQELVALGIGSLDSLCGIRGTHCSGLHLPHIQQIHEIARRSHQGSYPQHGARQRYSRHRSL